MLIAIDSSPLVIIVTKSNREQRLKEEKQIQHGVRFCSSLLQVDIIDAIIGH